MKKVQSPSNSELQRSSKPFGASIGRFMGVIIIQIIANFY
jgi:hypothetical protein